MGKSNLAAPDGGNDNRVKSNRRSWSALVGLLAFAGCTLALWALAGQQWLTFGAIALALLALWCGARWMG